MIKGSQFSETLVLPAYTSSFILALTTDFSYTYPLLVIGLFFFFSLCGHICIATHQIRIHGFSNGLEKYIWAERVAPQYSSLFLWSPITIFFVYHGVNHYTTERFDSILDIGVHLFSSWEISLCLLISFISAGLVCWFDNHRFDTEIRSSSILRTLGSIALLLYLSWNFGGITALGFVVLFAVAGSNLIPPIADIVWNYKNYNSPFKSYFLSKKRRLGPSLNYTVDQSCHPKDYRIDYITPPKNCSQQSSIGRDLTHKKNLTEYQIDGNTFSIADLNKQIWSCFTGPKYFSINQSSEPIILSVSDIKLINDNFSSPDGKIQAVITSAVCHNENPLLIADKSDSVEFIRSETIKTDKTEGIHVYLNLARNWDEDQKIDIIIYPVTYNRWAVFYLNSKYDESEIIIERILTSFTFSYYGTQEKNNPSINHSSLDFSSFSHSISKIANEIVMKDSDQNPNETKSKNSSNTQLPEELC